MQNILICGAGPTGLAAGLFLAKQGIQPLILESQPSISPYSKALGVNPRTLTLLESTGATEKILNQGWRCTQANLWHNNKPIVRVDLSKVGGRFPFMLVLSQSETEKIIEESLQETGVQVQRGHTLTNFEIRENKVYAEANTERYTADVLLGADGAHSTIRKSLEIDFPGSTYPENWKLYDLEMEFPYDPNQVHIQLLPHGFIFLLRVKDNLWRALGNTENLLEQLPKGTKTGKVHWESDFHIAHRIAQTLQQGPVCLAGDAAHLHSPMGARGMNLGIEDAYTFAKLLVEGKLGEYGPTRHTIDAKVVKVISRFTEVPRGVEPWVKIPRMLMPMIAPLILPLSRKWLMGLDHSV